MKTINILGLLASLFVCSQQQKAPIRIITSIQITTMYVDGKEKFLTRKSKVPLDKNYKITVRKKVPDYTDANYYLGTPTPFSKSGSFNKGLKTGHWQTLYKHTLVKSEHWNNGLITGKYTVYNTDKKILYQTNFESLGNGKYKDYYYKTGILKEEGNYENGKKEGKWCFYNSNGTLKDSIIYVKGVAKTKT
jgi:antitoxin component YwqK of YwqJK toxin-antitoxin module